MQAIPAEHSRAAAQRDTATTYFFVVALGVTWSLQLPAALAQLGVLPYPVESFMLPAALGGFGPLIAAVLAARREAGSAGTRALFSRLRIASFAPYWYVVALLVFGCVHVAGVAVYRALGGGEEVHWLYPPQGAQHVVAMLIVPWAEEPGWRGFALPRLQVRYGKVSASLLLGVVWSLYHVLMFVLQRMTPLTFTVAMVNILAGSIVFSWLFNRTRGSLLIALLAHAGAHLNNPTHALSTHPAPFFVYTAALCIAAGALVVLDRPAWRHASRAA